jgi:hypothetical protein
MAAHAAAGAAGEPVCHDGLGHAAGSCPLVIIATCDWQVDHELPAARG